MRPGRIPDKQVRAPCPVADLGPGTADTATARPASLPGWTGLSVSTSSPSRLRAVLGPHSLPTLPRPTLLPCLPSCGLLWGATQLVLLLPLASDPRNPSLPHLHVLEVSQAHRCTWRLFCLDPLYWDCIHLWASKTTPWCGLSNLGVQRPLMPPGLSQLQRQEGAS